MNTLITGASGFLGRHLSKRLSSEGHALTLLNSQTADLTKQGDLEEKLAGKSFDQIFHLASWSRAGAFCRENPGLQILVNQRIDVNVFDYWRTNQPCAKMIAMGSSVAYDPALPLKEENYLRGEPIADYLGYGNAKKMLYASHNILANAFTCYASNYSSLTAISFMFL